MIDAITTINTAGPAKALVTRRLRGLKGAVRPTKGLSKVNLC